MEIIESNRLKICGQVLNAPTLSHSIYGEDFYVFFVQVPRLSGNADVLPAVASCRLLATTPVEVGQYISIEGQLRSYNKMQDGASRLEIRVFVRELTVLEREESQNQIYLLGFICKMPTYRVTPFGREITDMLLAINRSYNKSDYIPAIAWGRNARYAKTLEVGQKLSLTGRVQSREYEKILPNGTKIDRVAYEVSIASLQIAE